MHAGVILGCISALTHVADRTTDVRPLTDGYGCIESQSGWDLLPREQIPAAERPAGDQSSSQLDELQLHPMFTINATATDGR